MTTMIPALLLALAAAAPTNDVDAVLARMTSAQGPAYLAARDELLTIGADARPVVDARLAAATTDGERQALLVARAWLVAPDACAHAYALDGLDPAIWTRTRTREPQVARELDRLPQDAKPVLLELWTKTRGAYPYAPASAYPKGLDPRAARAQEEQALAAGVLHALGAARLDAAPALLGQALVEERDPVLRRTAAQALGVTRAPGAVAVLEKAALDRSDDASVRAAAVVGLGSHRSLAALDVLARILSSDEDATVRTTAATSMANLASAWAAQARGDTDGGAALKDGALRALRAVKTDDAKLRAAVDASIKRLGG